MSNDARVSTGLPGHPKTKKLIRRLGPAAGWSLICLILWARDNRPDGDLSGMSIEDIELAADWTGENDAFVAALNAVRFLDGEAGVYHLHDWEEHQPWAAGSEARSESARWKSLCRHHGRAGAAEQMPEYAAKLARSIQSDAGSKKSDAGSIEAASNGNAGSKKRVPPSPLPNPSPYPKALTLSNERVVPSKPGTPVCPHAEIVAAYHELLPELARVRDWTPDRQAFLRSRWKESKERQTVEWWRGYFGYVRTCPFLMGQGPSSPDRDPFYADLEWLVRPKNFRKVIEGKYQRRAA